MTITGSCARHTCGHDAGDHADMRTPSGTQQLYRGACGADGCACPEWVDVAPCAGIAPVVVVATSGVLYERCACGMVKRYSPGAVVVVDGMPMRDGQEIDAAELYDGNHHPD